MDQEKKWKKERKIESTLDRITGTISLFKFINVSYPSCCFSMNVVH